MSDPLELVIAASRARGERFAVATALDGAQRGARLLVWSAGHTYGDLGWPRLNQRVALYAEQLLERGASVEHGASVERGAGGPLSKRFDVPGAGKVEVRIELAGGG